MMLNDALQLVKPALDKGIELEIKSQDGIICIDMNTRAKSECVLKLEDCGIVAHRRYDRVDPVESFEQLMLLIRDCSHGRDSFNVDWLELMDEYGIERPRGL